MRLGDARAPSGRIPHPGDLDDDLLGDLLLGVESGGALEVSDGLPEISLRHLHQSLDALPHTQDTRLTKYLFNLHYTPCFCSSVLSVKHYKDNV